MLIAAYLFSHETFLYFSRLCHYAVYKLRIFIPLKYTFWPWLHRNSCILAFAELRSVVESLDHIFLKLEETVQQERVLHLYHRCTRGLGLVHFTSVFFHADPGEKSLQVLKTQSSWSSPELLLCHSLWLS